MRKKKNSLWYLLHMLHTVCFKTASLLQAENTFCKLFEKTKIQSRNETFIIYIIWF